MPFGRVLIGENLEVRMSPVDLSARIRQIIADVLACKDGQLDPGRDIEIKMDRVRTRSGDYLPEGLDLSLSIEALPYPDRVRNQQDRGDEIRARLERLLPGSTAGVWLNLERSGVVSHRFAADPASGPQMRSTTRHPRGVSMDDPSGRGPRINACTKAYRFCPHVIRE